MQLMNRVLNRLHSQNSDIIPSNFKGSRPRYKFQDIFVALEHAYALQIRT